MDFDEIVKQRESQKRIASTGHDRIVRIITKYIDEAQSEFEQYAQEMSSYLTRNGISPKYPFISKPSIRPGYIISRYGDMWNGGGCTVIYPNGRVLDWDSQFGKRTVGRLFDRKSKERGTSVREQIGKYNIYIDGDGIKIFSTLNEYEIVYESMEILFKSFLHDIEVAHSR